MLGTLGLFGSSVGTLNEDDLRLGQALAHVASVAIVAGNAAADRETVLDQLQRALLDRIILEQAKGYLAQLGGLEMDDAYDRLFRYTTARGLRLARVAEAVVSGDLPGHRILDATLADSPRDSS